MTVLTNALDEHLKYRARTCANDSYLRTVRANVNKFVSHLGAIAHVEGILGYHLHQFEAAHEREPQVLSHVRQFLVWCRERYHVAVPQLARKPVTPRKHPQVLRGIADRKISVWQDNAAKAARHMVMPHQRAIFLLGYLYGMQLSDILTFSENDLHALASDMRDDLYAALGATKGWGPNIALFSPWLSSTRQTATKRWREWVGDDNVRFDDVVRAGQVDRVLAGMSPRCEKAVAHAIVNALPGLSKAGLERMKRFWG